MRREVSELCNYLCQIQEVPARYYQISRTLHSLHFIESGAKGWQHNNIALLDLRKVFVVVFVLFDKVDVLRVKFLVDHRVVNQLVRDVKVGVWESLHCAVCQIDRPFNLGVGYYLDTMPGYQEIVQCHLAETK